MIKISPPHQHPHQLNSKTIHDLDDLARSPIGQMEMEERQKRFGKLPGLSAEEKGRIYWKLVKCGEDEWKEAIPDFLDDDSVAAALRIKYLTPRKAEDDVAEDEVAALANRVPRFPLDGIEPTKNALESYLLDFQCLVGLIPVSRKTVVELPRSLQGTSPFFFSSSDLGVAVASAIASPIDGSGEQLVNFRIVRFCRILDCLKSFSSSDSRLDYDFSMDKVDSSASSQTARCRKRKRPDFMFEFFGLPFMLGEGRAAERDLSQAANEISKVPGWVCGSVNFLLAFALGGLKWQLFVKTATSAQHLEPLGIRYNLSDASDRVELVLLFFKLYFLCLSMRKHTAPTGMLPLFKEHKRRFSTIQLDGEGCVKVIENWKQYKLMYGTRLSLVRKAYSIPGVEQLVYAAVLPTVDAKGRYMIRTGPLGLPAKRMLTSEEEHKALAKDMLTALAALHRVSLVHRDVRLENVIFWPEKKLYVLIDLEMVTKPGKVMLDLPTDYTPATLIRHRYLKSSDVHQLGVLMENLRTPWEMSSHHGEFVKLLKSHSSTAEEMLSHPWLTMV